MTIPVVLDTDIGMDVDDVWALAFLLRCPELDLRMVITDSGNTHYSACVAAKLLTAAGRDDVPIGIGIPLDDVPRTHSRWLADYRLDQYRGPVHEDGVGALCDAMMQGDEPTTLICIGPIPNVAAALAREPQLTQHSRFVGMHGSLRRGYLGADKPMREYNVKKHALAAQQVFATPWDITITPLDSCGSVMLQGADFEKVRASSDFMAKLVMDNHFGWGEAVAGWPMMKHLDPHTQSSILFDTVAVYLAFADDLLEIEALPIIVTDDGKTLIDDAGQTLRCATGWRDYPGFIDLLTSRLTAQASTS